MRPLNATMEKEVEELRGRWRALKEYRHSLHEQLTEILTILSDLNKGSEGYEELQLARSNITRFGIKIDTQNEQEGTQNNLIPAQQSLIAIQRTLAHTNPLPGALQIINGLLRMIPEELNAISAAIQGGYGERMQK